MKTNRIYLLGGIVMILLAVLTVTMWISFNHSLRGSAVEEALQEDREYDRHFAMITRSSSSAFWRAVQESARQEAAEKNALLEVLDTETYSIKEAMRISIASGVDGIILEASTETSTIDMIDQAQEAGIPVVTVLRDASDSQRISFVGVNHYQLGKLYGEQILSLLTDDMDTVLVMIDEENVSAEKSLIFTQIRNTIAEGLPSGRSVEVKNYNLKVENTFDTEEAIRDILVGSDLPDVLVCMNEASTEATYQAVVDYNKVDQVEIVGYYTSDTILSGIENGIISATIVLSTQEMGRYCVDALSEYRDMGNVSNYFSVDPEIITPENIADYRVEKDEKNQS